MSNSQIEIKLKGHFYENSGYAKVNKNLALGLHSLGVTVYIDPLSHPDHIEFKGSSFLKKTNKNSCICIDSMTPIAGQESFGKYNILYTAIETRTVPKSFLDLAKNYREVWVTSDFCKEVLNSYDFPRPIFVLPDSVDTTIYKEEGEKYVFNKPLKPFVFISVSRWSYRKGFDVLLKSFIAEFSEKDPVSLLIVSKSPNKDKDEIKNSINKYIKESGKKDIPHIVRMSKEIDEKDMPSIYRACNAFALYTRAEGYGYGYVEASLCGLPVISTNFSGQTMFLKKENSYLLDIDHFSKLQSGMMYTPFWDNQEFPSLTTPDTLLNARKLMREVFTNYSQAKNKNKILQNFISQIYSITKVASLAKEKLQTIWSKLS